MKIEVKCRDFGDRPGCLGEPDERFTMRFDDIGEEPIHWCAFCGPGAKAFDDALMKFLTASPENVVKVREAIDKVEASHAHGDCKCSRKN